MIVCLCKQVSDTQIAEHVRRGATTVREIGRVCGAGTDCGSCRCLISMIIEANRPLPVAADEEAAILELETVGA